MERLFDGYRGFLEMEENCACGKGGVLGLGGLGGKTYLLGKNWILIPDSRTLLEVSHMRKKYKLHEMVYLGKEGLYIYNLHQTSRIEF